MNPTSFEILPSLLRPEWIPVLLSSVNPRCWTCCNHWCSMCSFCVTRISHMFVVLADLTKHITDSACSSKLTHSVTLVTHGWLRFCKQSLVMWQVLRQVKQVPSTTLTSNFSGEMLGTLWANCTITSRKLMKENRMGIWNVAIKSANVLLCAPFTTASIRFVLWWDHRQDHRLGWTFPVLSL